MRTLGLYVHVPFCAGGKCPYCDFYSLPYSEEMAQGYLQAAAAALEYWARRIGPALIDNVYFGGGTPSLLGAGLASLLSAAGEAFSISPCAEITFEANPAGMPDCLPMLREAGFNRISIGMQSSNPRELALLGRRHRPEDVEQAVAAARSAGFENISLDLMLAVPSQTRESLLDSIAFAAGLGVKHISAYLLKVEPGTPFERRKESLALPDDDAQAFLYLEACRALERAGYAQYEISNFAKKGFESRHNLRYWDCGEYLGVGPGAHSFLNGRRFYYPKNLEAFLDGGQVIDDGEGGSPEEYIMLRLRLREGLSARALICRYGTGFERFDPAVVKMLADEGYLLADGERLRLTRKGFLVSNAVIARLLFS